MSEPSPGAAESRQQTEPSEAARSVAAPTDDDEPGPYDGHPDPDMQVPPRDLLDQVPDVAQRLCIAGTEEQRVRSAQKLGMLNYREASTLRRMLRLRGTLFQNSWGNVLAVVAVSLFLTIAHIAGGEWVVFHDKPHTLSITPIGFLLVFRSNLSFARWWEGRGILGGMVFAARNIALKTLTYTTAAEAGDRAGREVALQHSERVVRLALGMVVSIRHDIQFRTASAADVHPDAKQAMRELRYWELAHYLSPSQMGELRSSPGVPPPMLISRMLTSAVMQPCAEDSQMRYLWDTAVDDITKHVEDLLSAWQGMMKIVTTPMPFPYAHSLEVFLNLWMFTVPLTLLDSRIDMGWWTVPVCAVMAVLLFGINNVGSEIEDPFGNDVNDFCLVKFQVGLHKEMQALVEMQARSMGAEDVPVSLWAVAEKEQQKASVDGSRA